MSSVNKEGTLMCVRITEPSPALVGCSLAQVRERVVRKASRMFADKLFDESQVVVRNIQHFGAVPGYHDITYEVELALVPVAEHKKQVQMLQDELFSVRAKLHAAQATIDAQARKLNNIKEAWETNL